MLKELITKERQNLDHFFENLDLAATEKLIDTLENCNGTLFFSGIGKSEVMAKKIAVTMASIGTKALFIAPTNALHGDIGLLTAQDILIMLSRGGETEELVNLIPHVRCKGATTVAIVSDAASRLSKMCDMTIALPLAKELCPFNLVPTTSAQIQMIFGDLLTVALMKRKNFTLDQYAENHPSGKIGRRITIRVSDLMLRGDELPLCRPDEKILNALMELSKKRCGCVLITDENQTLQGIFTDGDLGRALNAHGQDVLSQPISQQMSAHPQCVSPDTLAWKALQQMEQNAGSPITVLAVTDSANKLIGLIKMHDILQAGI